MVRKVRDAVRIFGSFVEFCIANNKKKLKNCLNVKDGVNDL